MAKLTNKNTFIVSSNICNHPSLHLEKKYFQYKYSASSPASSSLESASAYFIFFFFSFLSYIFSSLFRSCFCFLFVIFFNSKFPKHSVLDFGLFSFPLLLFFQSLTFPSQRLAQFSKGFIIISVLHFLNLFVHSQYQFRWC